MKSRTRDTEVEKPEVRGDPRQLELFEPRDGMLRAWSVDFSARRDASHAEDVLNADAVAAK